MVRFATAKNCVLVNTGTAAVKQAGLPIMQSVVGKVYEAKKNLLWISRGQSWGEGEEGGRITEMENKWSEWKSCEKNNKNNAEVWRKSAEGSGRTANGLLMQQRTRCVRRSILNAAFHRWQSWAH